MKITHKQKKKKSRMYDADVLGSVGGKIFLEVNVLVASFDLWFSVVFFKQQVFN